MKTAVSEVKELCTVQDTTYQLRTNNGKVQSYTEYCSLLISVETTYDRKNKSRSFNSNSENIDNRRIYQHDFQADIERENYFNIHDTMVDDE